MSACVYKDEHVPLNLKEYKIQREGELPFITNNVSELLIVARSCENMPRLSCQMDLTLLISSQCYYLCFSVFICIEMRRIRYVLEPRLILLFAFQDFIFHGATFVFYFGAFLLQAATTSLHYLPRKFNSTTQETILSGREYNISIAASVCVLCICIRGAEVCSKHLQPAIQLGNVTANWN